MIFYCDYTKQALKDMDKLGMNNDDIQEIFNIGFSESLTHKFLDKNGFRTGIYHQYDGYTKRYVILSIYHRPLKTFRNKKG